MTGEGSPVAKKCYGAGMDAAPDPPPSRHPLAVDIGRGMAGRCPRCGRGRMFASYLKVAPACDVCGEALHHHRADDLPAFIVMFIAGPVLVPLACYCSIALGWSLGLDIAVWLPLATLLILALLPPVKGVIVALQWRLGLHGFAAAKQSRKL